MNDGSPHRVQFGPYEADFSTQEIWKHGTRLKLAGQPFEILAMLVSRPGELVSREDLERRLWPEGHFVDATHGLNAAVNKLRDALSDSAEQPKYIETLPRRGYRFIAEVVAVVPTAETTDLVPADRGAAVLPEPVAVHAAAELANTGMSRNRSRSAVHRWPILITAVVGLVGGTFIGVVVTNRLWSHQSTLEEFAKNAAERHEAETTAKKEEERVASSIGAREMRAKANKSSLDLLPQRDRYSTLRPAEFRTIIPGDAGNAAPQFSPDGRRIAFMSNRSGPWQIWISNSDGTNPVQVSSTQSAGSPRWSPDGQSIAFDAPMDDGTHIFVAPVAHPDRARPLAEGRVPSFSRDGKFVYFASERTGQSQVWKVPLGGGPEVQVTTDGGFAAMESPDGNVYYAKSGYANPEIWKVPVGGGVEVCVSPHLKPRTWSSWTVTKEGILLIADLPDGKSDLSLYDPAKRTTRELSLLKTAPRWMGATTDGKRVVMNDAAERQITMLENVR